MDDVTMQRPAGARIISFESFLRRTWGTRPDGSESQAASPFGHCAPTQRLTQRQINHRQVMLKYLLSSRWDGRSS